MTFNIKAPILGFEQIKEVDLEKVDNFFMKLKSCEDENIFMLINPFLLRDYDFEVPEYFKNLLELKEDSNTMVLNTMIISKPIETSVINFIAPLVFNTDKGLVAQVLLDGNKYKEYGLTENISDYIRK